MFSIALKCFQSALNIFKENTIFFTWYCHLLLELEHTMTVLHCQIVAIWATTFRGKRIFPLMLCKLFIRLNISLINWIPCKNTRTYLDYHDIIVSANWVTEWNVLLFKNRQENVFKKYLEIVPIFVMIERRRQLVLLKAMCRKHRATEE